MKRFSRMTKLVTTLGSIVGLLVAAPSDSAAQATLLGPTPYTSRADSPFDTAAFGFCVEDFENGKFDVPGASVRGGGTYPADIGLRDSVDADDGVIDGSGADGDSLAFEGDGLFSGPLIIDFNPDRTNGLPTEVGIVWTDGTASATFSAYGANGGLLVGVNGPNAHADASYDGETAEDRFYGVTDPAGISKIHISSADLAVEVDHLQLNRCILCGDADSDLDIDASDTLFALRSSVGIETCLNCFCDTNNDGRTSVDDARQILRIAIGNVAGTSCPPCEGL